jgi:hypothetical protein
MISLSSAKRAVSGTVIVILVLTGLGFPPPIGFETRPQSSVSLIWLAFFLVIFALEMATIPLIYKRPVIGGGIGMLVAVLSILQVLADQAHLMQPEVAPLGYSILEGMSVIASLALAYFSWAARRAARMPTS